MIEGAGSPAEINLRENDIVNMARGPLADAPVLLVGDIDRGGVFASLYGTWALLDDADRARLRGFVVNKFRGDVTILEPGLRELEERTGMRCVGVLPYLRDVGVDDEDSVALDESAQEQSRRVMAADGWPVGEGPNVAVIRLPRVSNFTDFRPLEQCGLFRVRWAERPTDLDGADLVIVPGTKSTVGDLLALRERGFEAALAARRAAGAHVLGVCGGYQMLGERILDPDGVESRSDGSGGARSVAGDDDLHCRQGDRAGAGPRGGAGWLDADVGVQGYEIHMGLTEGACAPSSRCRKASAAGRPEGSVSDDGRVAGTYVHGLFDDYSVLAGLARVLGVSEERIAAGLEGRPARGEANDAAYDRLAAVLRENLDMDFVRALVRGEV